MVFVVFFALHLIVLVGSVVESSPAMRVARVRYSDDAPCSVLVVKTLKGHLSTEAYSFILFLPPVLPM